MTVTLELKSAPLKYMRTVDTVLSELEAAILAGRIRPGERLVETAIAERFNVGRTTVREALLMLQERGLVLRVPRGGTFVNRLSREDALELAYTRSLLECFAVTVGYAHLSEEHFVQMQAQIASMRQCAMPDDLPNLIKIDLAFHRTLVEAAQMPRVLDLWSRLDGQIGALYIRGVEQQEFDVEAIASLHENLLNAIRTGDVETAQRAVHRHYVRADQIDSSQSQALESILSIMAPAERESS